VKRAGGQAGEQERGAALASTVVEVLFDTVSVAGAWRGTLNWRNAGPP
jgi:hypothetical protein